MPFDLTHVRRELPYHRIHYHDTLPSTQPLALRYAEEGAPSGTIIVADQQTAGMGRHGHAWHSSEPNAGIYASIILHPKLEPATRPLLTLALGLATAEAIFRITGLDCDIRWPNDVMSRERKLAGILVQLAGNAAVAGIGINVNHERFPESLTDQATSISLETGERYPRADLLVALIQYAMTFAHTLESEGKQAILTLFSQRSTYAIGKAVRVDMGEKVIQGVTAGLDENGFLMIRKADGKLERVLAGGVRPL